MSVSDVVRAAQEFTRLLAAAESVQWDTPPGRKPVPEQERGGSGVSDPTADAALDEVRLELRAAVRSVALAERAAVSSLSAAAERLRVALAAWAGERTDK